MLGVVVLLALLPQSDLLQTLGKRRAPVCSWSFCRWLLVRRFYDAPKIMPRIFSLWNPSGLLSQSVTSFPDWARREFSRPDSRAGSPYAFLCHPCSEAGPGGRGALWSVAVWPRVARATLSAAQHSGLAGGSRPWAPIVSWLPRQPPSLHAWHSYGPAINYAQCVHFQFKCVLIPEERLMASGYWYAKSLPLRWLWINEISVMEAGAAINRQPRGTQI